jgi:hypothetical protein
VTARTSDRRSVERIESAGRIARCMDRQQVLAIILVILMIGSSVAYGAALLL